MPYWFDGNNLIGLSAAAAKADRRTRREFLSNLASCRKPGGGRFLVFFDGDDPGDLHNPPGVAIHYSAPESADTAIVRRLGEIERVGEVIVVTNDINLADRCRRAGAATLGWNRFSSKLYSRPSRLTQARKRAEDPVDVEDWMRYFGIDEKDR